jgi:hypothetical protein
MRFRIAILIAAAACAHAAPRPSGAGPVVQGGLDADERAVYAALVKREVAEGGRVVVSDSTFRGDWPRWTSPLPGLDSAAAAEIEGDFRRRNQTAVAFPADLAARRSASLFAVREVFTDTVTNLDQAYATFRARFPGARRFHSFSRPGFDAARRHALVLWSHACGSLCGEGGFAILERGPDGWRETYRQMMWVS